jgi:hypothetical protein
MVQIAAAALLDKPCVTVTIADVAAVKAAERDREETLAFVSHDLRSPASSIALLAEMTLSGSLDRPQDALMRDVRRLAGRILEMSEAFVRAAHVRNQPLHIETVSMTALIDEAMRDVEAQAADAGVGLVRAPCDTDDAVRLDRGLVVRAVANLVGNAVRHSARSSTVVIEVTCDAGGACIGVRDFGAGLTDSQIERLDGTEEGLSPEGGQGVGLGIVFVQRVARRHGGRLRARRGNAGGAIFELTLPAPGSRAQAIP